MVDQRSEMLQQYSTLINFLIVVLNGVIISGIPDEVKVTILHTNDVHSRFQQTNKYSGRCSTEDELRSDCYGGFARLHHKVKEIRSTEKNVVYLSGGDYYQGTVWYTLHKWKVVSKFVNILNHTAMAFGNHEFDDGISGIVPFLEASAFPVVSCNIDASKEPSIQGKFKKSHIVVLDTGEKVGIIGYTTEDTQLVSKPGNLIFDDIVTSVRKETEKLYSEGVKILIAIGHAGYDIDMKIAKEVPLIDVVVGGHTNTFLSTGQPPDIEQPAGPYPTVVEQPGTLRKVPVVQAYAYGKYLGYLQVTFDSQGEATSYRGNPILLNSSVLQDPKVLQEIEIWRKNISEGVKDVVGTTRVFLNGSSAECRRIECNLGNLVMDAMVHASLQFTNGSDIMMALMNGGGIRGSINEASNQGSITVEDILTVLPFSDTVDFMEIKGEHLRQVFEHSVHGYDPQSQRLQGKFLQVSGMKVTYDITKPNGQRVKGVLVRCKKCRVPMFVPLHDEEVYKVAMSSFIAEGGDGYKVIKDNAFKHHTPGIIDRDMLTKYIQSRSPIIRGVDGRITFESDT